MRSDFTGPVKIGSDEMVTIHALARMTMEIAGKALSIRRVPGPLGVRGRNSDNRLTAERLGWRPPPSTDRWTSPDLSMDRAAGRTQRRLVILSPGDAAGASLDFGN